MTTKPHGTQPVFLLFDDFADLLPIPLSLPQALKRSYRNKFPRAHRFVSRKEKPRFERSALISWVRNTFLAACPELVADFESEIRKVKGTRLALRGDTRSADASPTRKKKKPTKTPKRNGRHDKGRA